jgi:hypothetical protein
MEDFPARFADFLEMIATRVRSVTVDRINRWIRLSSLGMAALVLGLLALVFLVLSIYGALAIPLGSDGAFGVLGLVVLIFGLILWGNRKKAS